MAVAKTRESLPLAAQALPYGAAALVTIAAIFSAWPLYLTPSFPYLALLLVLVGTPASMYLRSVGINRRLLNIGIVGVSLAFVFAMLRSLRLPTAGGDIFELALLIDDREAIAFVIQMFITVAMFRSFSLLTDRDLTLSIVPALSALLLSAIAARGPMVMAAMLLFFLGALYLLAFQHQETWAAQAQVRRLLPAERRRSLLASVAASMWLVLVPAMFVAAVAFMWINLPRLLLLRYGSYASYLLTTRVYQLATPSWITPADSIHLGSGLPLRKNVMFRVASTDNALWRSTTFDTYTRRGWRNSQPTLRSERLTSQDGKWIVPSHDPGLPAGVPSSELDQVFHLETWMQAVLIAAYEPRVLSGDLRRPHVGDSAVIFDSAPARPGETYHVISRRKAAPSAAAYRPGVRLSARERERYLSLPEIPQRTRRLVRRVVSGERDNLHRAVALNAFLEEKFIYRERVTPPPAAADAVDYFLHDMDGAYCDYFASALAVMARTAGIPSRVVRGFRSTEEDEETGWWLVREKHAHSWVEVFIDGYGWFELDPSPALGSAPTLLERAQKAVAAAFAAAKRGVGAPFRMLTAMPGWWWKLPAALAATALAALGLRYLRREKAPPLPRDGDGEQLRHYARHCYERMRRWLRQWGLPKAPGATASEYAVSLARALGPQAAPMRDVIEAYLAAEYGGRRLGLGEARGLRQRMETVLGLRKLLARHAADGDEEP